MNLLDPDSLPDHRQPKKGAPNPLAGLALATSLAVLVLWLDGPASAVQTFLGVLAFLEAVYRARREQR
ncbi:hypothetical protein [Actinopolymorpha pittospori]|uniref:Uncharacterized protein n=1 Tax=Actinopolymorpha pittospori TaxID=648752 RepID=A0A927RND1_9ACTN|nr:hypothetical protein [Actinopolymorpha pittospori]MBE1609933.1 hypothetical protein [Actinopolymorpha pittospori]